MPIDDPTMVRCRLAYVRRDLELLQKTYTHVAELLNNQLPTPTPLQTKTLCYSSNFAEELEDCLDDFRIINSDILLSINHIQGIITSTRPEAPLDTKKDTSSPWVYLLAQGLRLLRGLPYNSKPPHDPQKKNWQDPDTQL